MAWALRGIGLYQGRMVWPQEWVAEQSHFQPQRQGKAERGSGRRGQTPTAAPRLCSCTSSSKDALPKPPRAGPPTSRQGPECTGNISPSNQHNNQNTFCCDLNLNYPSPFNYTIVNISFVSNIFVITKMCEGTFL